MLLEIVKDFPVDVFQIDSDQNKEIIGQYLVFAVPTILIFHESKEVLRESRFIDFQRIKRLLEIFYEN